MKWLQTDVLMFCVYIIDYFCISD